MGPLRGSHGSIKLTKKPLEVVTGAAPVNFDASLLNGVFTSFSQMMAAYNSQGLMQPNPQITFVRARPQLALEDACRYHNLGSASACNADPDVHNASN